jgi:TPR repeat protein
VRRIDKVLAAFKTIRLRPRYTSVTSQSQGPPMKSWTALAVVALVFVSGAAGGAEAPATYGDAMRWYERAAADGSAKAQFLLGRMYEQGMAGRARDLARAAALYEKAAAQGHVLAQFSLGTLYLNGRGVARDPKTAAKWFAAGAEKGLAEAQYDLGYLHDRGIGVAPDRAAAEKWYRAAARQGLTSAQVNLALVLVAAGPSRRAAQVEAWAWLSLAVAHGANQAKAIADDIALKLTAAEKAEAAAMLEKLNKEVPRR